MLHQSTIKVKKNQTQLEKANGLLLDLAVNVTAEDRREAEKSRSQFTIVQYLNGRGTNLGTAMQLLEFFRTRIKERERKLS